MPIRVVSASATSARSDEPAFAAVRLVRDEDVRLVQLAPDHVSDHRRKHAERKHPAPADDRQQHRRHQRRHEHAELPAKPDIGRCSRALARGPGFRHQRHADAEFAAETNAGDGPVGQQVPIALGQRARPGEARTARCVQVRAPRTRPSRSDSMPKTKPPTTAPTSVPVTSEAASGCVR